MATTATKHPSSNTTSGSGSSWTNPANAYSSNNSYATSAGSWSVGSSQSVNLNLSGFGFTNSDLLDTDVIDGITLNIERKANTANAINDITIQLLDSTGALIGTNQATTTKWPTTDGVATYGGSANMMGTTLTAAQIKAGIGVRICCVTANASAFANYTASIDDVNLAITYHAGPSGPSPALGFLSF